MLKEHEKWAMADKAKKNNFFIEVNWNPDDKTTNKSKVLRFTFPDGKTAFIPRQQMQEILFAIGTPKDQQRMIPQKLTKVRWYETVLGIKATKNIAKGQMINVPVKISLPTVEEEIIAELKKENRNKSGIIVPKGR